MFLGRVISRVPSRQWYRDSPGGMHIKNEAGTYVYILAKARNEAGTLVTINRKVRNEAGTLVPVR